MKKIFWLLLMLPIQQSVYSQGYYPLRVGNRWQYWDCYDSLYPYQVEALQESTMTNGNTYAFLSKGGALRQLGSKVYAFNTPSDFLIYDFSKTTDDTVAFHYYPSGDTTIVTVAYDRYVNKFGRILRQWGFYEKWINSISLYYLREVTDSIGLTYEEYEPGIENCMSGAIIDGIEYGAITDIGQNPIFLPTEYSLYQNYPNPFNPSTTISYDLAGTKYVRLNVYNIVGQAVATLVDGIQHAGHQSITFKGDNLPSGIYYYRLQTGTFFEVKKMVLAK